jgi:hypothetical protein
VPGAWVEEYHAWQCRVGGGSGAARGGGEVYTESSVGLDLPINNVNVENVGEDINLRNARVATPIPFPVDVNVRPAGGSGSPPHGYVGKRYEENGNGNGNGNGTDENHDNHGRGSGRLKSEDLRQALVDLVASDRFGALRALDTTDRACHVWHHCCQDHPALVGAVLTDLLATWPRVKCPAAWVMKRLYPIFKADRRRSADTSTRGGTPAAARRAVGGSS